MCLRPAILILALAGACAVPDRNPPTGIEGRSMYVIALKHALAVEVVVTVGEAIGRRPYLSLRADPESNAILVSGTPREITLVRLLIDQLDEPGTI